MEKTRILPPAYVLVALLLMIGLGFAAPLYVFTWSPWRLLGLMPLIAGVVLDLVADHQFHQARTTVKPFQHSTSLVTDGAFVLSRNPMYLGFLLVLVGLAILMAALSPLAVVVAFVVLIEHNFIRPEERMLAEQFGMDYKLYAARTPRWI